MTVGEAIAVIEDGRPCSEPVGAVLGATSQPPSSGSTTSVPRARCRPERRLGTQYPCPRPRAPALPCGPRRWLASVPGISAWTLVPSGERAAVAS